MQAYLEVYNIVFTALPIILFCVFDQDVTKAESAVTPRLYTPGLLRIYYTHFGFLLWMLEAIWLALLAVFVPALSLGYPGCSLAAPRSGDPDVATISLSSMVLVCVGVNLRLAIEMHSWHFLEHLFLWGSILAIEIAALVFSFVWSVSPPPSPFHSPRPPPPRHASARRLSTPPLACPTPPSASASSPPAAPPPRPARRYPSFLPLSFDWNQLHAVVTYSWVLPAFWLASVLVIVASLAPRMIGLANDAVSKGHAARRRRRIVISRQRRETERTVESLSRASMAVPSREEMDRYRGGTETHLAAATGVGRASAALGGARGSLRGASSDGQTTPGGRRQGTGSFAFSNNDRSSISLLASFGRVSLGRRPDV